MKKIEIKRFIGVVVIVLVVTYALLLIPEREFSLPSSDAGSAKNQPFAWNQDSYWQALEAKYKLLQQSGCTDIADPGCI